MKIQFKKVTLENFLSFREAELEFNQNGFVQVIGNNFTQDDGFSNDSQGSNGSGKSSIFSSIVWALTGQTVSGVKNPENIFTEDTCIVRVEFSLDSDTYKITRTRRPSGLKIELNNRDISGKGIRDTEEILKNRLGILNSELLNSVIVLGQGLPLRLSNHSPSGRKEILEKLSQSDFMIEDLKNKVSKRESILKEEKRNFEDEMISLNTTREFKVSSKNQLSNQLVELAKLDLKELEEKISHNSKVILNSTNQLNKLNSDISDLEQQKEIELSRLKAILSKNVDLIDLSQLNITLAEKRTLLISKQAELKRLREIKTECPTCHQKLPHTHKPDTSFLEKEIQEIVVEGKKLKEEFDKLTLENTKTKTEFEEKIKKERLEVDSLIDKLNKELIDKRTLHNNLQSEINFLNIENVSLKNTFNSYEKEKLSLETQINQLNKDLESLEVSVSDVEKHISEKTYSLSIIAKIQTLLKRDFRGILLQNVIDYLQGRLNDYSNIVYEKGKLELEIENNNLNIKVNSKLYETLSGGEKTKVDIILQLAIRDLLINQFDFYSNILVIDEVTDFLDEKSAEVIYNLFTKINVDTTYIISHRKDFTIPIDSVLTVIKENNISRIEN